MSNNAAWLLLSFGIMVVAMLATLYEKVEQLEKRVNRLEAAREPDDETAAPAAGPFVTEPFGHRDHRA
jgi:hypothetical protein